MGKKKVMERTRKPVSCARWADLLGGRRAGRSALRRVVEFVGSEGRVSACTLERFESDAVSKLGDSDDGRVIFLDKFPETCTE